MATIFPNRFDAQCCNPSCKAQFRTGQGFCEKSEKGYRLFCRNCVPQQIQPTVAVQAKPRRVLTKDFEIITPKEPENLTLFRSFPGSRWTGTCWSVSASEGDRARVLELADRLGLDVDPSCRVVTRSARAEAARSLGLYQYQVDGVDFLSKRKHSLLGDQMGLGKTVQSLLALDISERVLAVVPAGLKYNWRDEIAQWRPDFKIVIIKSKAKFRWPEMGEIVIISKEMLPEFLTPVKQQGEKYATAQWQLADKSAASEVTLIVDEAHKYKNYKAACSKRMGQLSRAVKKVIALTGTPLMNHPADLFGVLSSIGMVGQVFGSWDKFCDLFGASRGRFGMEWGQPSPEVAERLRRVMLARRREEVLPDLPRKQYVNVTVEATGSITKQYDELEQEFGSAMEVTGELPPFRAMSKVRAEVAASRIPAMLEFVENCEEQDEPLVVFSDFLAPLDALITRQGWACISGDTPPEQRQDIVRAFQAGKLKGVALTITAGGVGLTLTRASKMLFVDLNWVPANNWQAEDRICRIGQTADKVTIYRMVSNHPMDRHIHNLLAEKVVMIEAAINAKADAQVPVSGPVAAPVVTGGESEEDYRRRMDTVRHSMEEYEARQQEEKKRAAKDRIGIILGRESGRATTEGKGRKLLPLTADRIPVVREAFNYMLSVCDGAVMRDDVGFNKPDAMVGHVVLTTGLETDAELQTAYWMLTRYHRQLSDRFPKLFAD